MKKYVVFKDIKKCRTKQVFVSKIPFFVLNDFDLIGKETAENLSKLKFINEYKYKISNRKEKDILRLETLNKDEIDLTNIELSFNNRKDIKEGTLADLVDFYAYELGYADYEDLIYHINLQAHNKKR